MAHVGSAGGSGVLAKETFHLEFVPTARFAHPQQSSLGRCGIVDELCTGSIVAGKRASQEDCLANRHSGK